MMVEREYTLPNGDAKWTPRLLVEKAIRPLLRNVLGSSSDHKEEILSTFMRAVKWWDLPPGDYLEFGVYQGRSFIYAYRQAQKHRLDMHFYAFDSFEGLPEVKGQDGEYAVLRRGDYACDEPSFQRALIDNGVDLERVTVVPGFYDNTLNAETKKKLPLNRAAVVWIDCDIYESTKLVLDFVTPYLTTGSIIAFDDWFLFGADPKAGEMRAAREWLGENRYISLVDYRQFGLFGHSFIVQVKKRRARPPRRVRRRRED
jgi:hypothetical protein